MIFLLAFSIIGCGGGDETGGSSSIDVTTDGIIVLAWNEAGMHTMDSTYNSFAISPPGNDLWAQVIVAGDPPMVTVSDISVEYSIENNTSSADKSSFGQFWEYALDLFGFAIPDDVGLSGNGLSGSMTASGDHFVAEGIPVTPVDDDSVENPYQVATVTVRDSRGEIMAQTETTIPVSSDMDCTKCHNDFTASSDILALHDKYYSVFTTISGDEPVLCIECHLSGNDSLETFTTATGIDLSSYEMGGAMHSGHAGATSEDGDTVACEDCHVSSGIRTTINTAMGEGHKDYSCEDCHGPMIAVVNSPSCATADCHENVVGVDTSDAPYRYSTESNHGTLYCAGCHQAAHALTPSDLESDNYQAMQYQDNAMALGDCRPCHRTSILGTVAQFNEWHTGIEGNESMCNICHIDWSSGVTAEDYPHQYSWQYRE